MKTLKYLSILTVISVTLASCSSTNQVASSFGKRKYMKGYYFNMPSHKQDYVASVQQPAPIAENTQYAETESPALASSTAVRLQPEIKSAVSAKNPVPYRSSIKITRRAEMRNTAEPQRILLPVQNSVKTDGNKNSGGGGDASKNWAAVAGFICAFFIPLLGLIFSIIGLKSEHKGLAIAGVIISIVFMVIILATVL